MVHWWQDGKEQTKLFEGSDEAYAWIYRQMGGDRNRKTTEVKAQWTAKQLREIVQKTARKDQAAGRSRDFTVIKGFEELGCKNAEALYLAAYAKAEAPKPTWEPEDKPYPADCGDVEPRRTDEREE